MTSSFQSYYSAIQMPLFKVGNSGGIFGSTIQIYIYIYISCSIWIFGLSLITVPGRNTNAIDILFLNLSRLLLRACRLIQTDLELTDVSYKVT